jgi:hypothetical protein
VILGPVQAAWLAAALDGEGSIGFKTDKKKLAEGKRATWPCLTISNTEKVFVENFIRLTGGRIVADHNNRGWNGHSAKILYRGQVYGRHIETILTKCLPYLLIKKDKALEVLNWFKTNPRPDMSETRRKMWAAFDPVQKAARMAPLQRGYDRWASRLSPEERRARFVAMGKASGEARRKF